MVDAPSSGFPSEEYEDRLEGLREAMEVHGLDACVLTSPWNLGYYTGLLQTGFGPPDGLVVTHGHSVILTGQRSGGRALRRRGGEVLTYDEGQRDGFWRAAASALGTGQAIGCEADHLTLMQSEKLNAFLKPKRGVDLALATMLQRMVKSEAEIALLRAGAAVADLGMGGMWDAAAPGARECDIAWAGRAVMEREIARILPDAEFQGTQALVQSGPNSDGAALPATGRRPKAGDVIGLTSSPMLDGYSATLKRTLVLGAAHDANRPALDAVLALRARAMALLKPGPSCGRVAEALLAEMAGQAFEVAGLGGGLPDEPLLALRPDNDTVLEPGMMIALAPMLRVQMGRPGEGGYGVQDLVLITEHGCEALTRFAVADGA